MAMIGTLLITALTGTARAAEGTTPTPISETFEQSEFNVLGGELGTLSNFGLVAFDTLTSGAHTNSNLVTRNLAGGQTFGTNNVETPEVSYVANSVSDQVSVNLNNDSVLVLGQDIDAHMINDNQWNIAEQIANVNVTGSRGVAQAIWQDTSDMKFLDLDDLRTQALNLSNALRSESQSGADLVSVDISSDQNNRTITLSPNASRVVLNFTAAEFCKWTTPVKLLGAGDSAQTVVINIDAAGKGEINLPQFDIGTTGHGEVTSWTNTNVIFNIYDSSAQDRQYHQVINNGLAFSGVVLAPCATMNSYSNLNGQIIAENINIRAEFHRDSYDVSAGITAHKELEGATLEPGQFSFTLTAGENDAGVQTPMPADAEDGSLTVANSASGAVDFGRIAYTKAGTYWYTVHEVIPDDAVLTHNDGTSVTYAQATDEEKESGTFVEDSVSYDASISYSVKVVVTENAGAFMPTVSYTRIEHKAGGQETKQAVTEASFVNTYEAETQETRGALSLSAAKVMEGRSFQEGDTFAFRVSGDGNAPLPSGVTQVTDDGSSNTGEVIITPNSGSSAVVDFGTITFTAPGEYAYTIWEETPADRLTGVAYSDEAYRLTVSAKDDDNNGVLELSASLTKVFDAAGNRVSELVFEKSSEDGTLAVGGASDGLSFTNAYRTDELVLEPVARKRLYRYDERADSGLDSFSFTLTPVKEVGGSEVDGDAPVPADSQNRVRTVQSDAGGNVAFGAIRVTTEDVPEGQSVTYVYRMQEQVPEGAEQQEDGSWVLDGMTYDGAAYYAQYVVSNDDGELSVKATYLNADGSAITDDRPVFTNRYEARATSVSLGANKLLEGADLADYAFSFTLTAGDNTADVSTPMPEGSEDGVLTAKNNAQGVVDFGSITFTQPGTYTYEIAEQNDGQLGVTYDNATHKVEVTVTDADGSLSAVVTYDGQTDKPVFKNSYVKNAATAILHARKTLDDAVPRAGMFTFELREGTDGSGKLVDKATNNADGFVNFQQLTWDEPGTYQYTIREVIPEGAEQNDDGLYVLDGVAYDCAVHQVEVTVTRDGDTASLKAAVSYDGVAYAGDSTYPVFQNSTVSEEQPEQPETPTPDAVDVPLKGTKTIEGRDFQEGDTFTFEIDPVDGAPAFERGTVTVKPTSGTSVRVDFGSATFETAGTYVYHAYEKASDVEGMTYDTDVRTVTVTVSEKDGELVPEVSYADADDGQLDGLLWTNTYDQPETPEEPTTPETPETPETSTQETVSQPVESEKPEQSAETLPTTGDLLGMAAGVAVVIAVCLMVGGIALRRRHH